MQATLKQRMSLVRMRNVLGKSIVGIRDLTIEQASKEISELIKEIEDKGFQPDDER